NRTLRQNPVEHRAVGIASDNNDRAVRLIFLDHVVNVVRRTIGQFQIQEHKIKFLFFECGQRFLNGADDDATKTNFAKEKLEKILQTLVIIDHEHGWLAGLVFLENVFIERGFFDSPAATDLDSRQLASLDKIVNGRQRD